MILILFNILVRLILTIIIVHYTTGLFDTVECVSNEDASYPGDEDNTVKDKTSEASKLIDYAAVIVTHVIIGAIYLYVSGAFAEDIEDIPDPIIRVYPPL